MDDETALGELRSVRVYAGLCGLGPGQLEDELDEQSWVVLPARAADVFTAAPDALWSEVLRRQGARSASSRSSPMTRTSTEHAHSYRRTCPKRKQFVWNTPWE